MQLYRPIECFTSCRAILFDLDGTLIDSYEAIGQSLNYALAEMGFPTLPRDRIRSMVGRGLKTLMTEASDAAHADEGIRHFRRRYGKIFLDLTRLLPGVQETVEALFRQGYAMAVVTNKPAFFSREIIEHLGLGSCLPVVYGPDRVAHTKPHPEMVEKALEDLGVDPESSVLVGDMDVDIQTARRAGILSVGVATGSMTRADLEKARPDVMLDRFEELLALFDGTGNLGSPCP